MGRFAVGPLVLVGLVCAGCLYIDPVNHAPAIDLTLIGATDVRLGATMHIAAHVSDLDGDALTPVEWTIADASGHTPPSCAIHTAPSGDGLDVILSQHGLFTITASVRDSRGAVGRSSVALAAANVAPHFAGMAQIVASVEPDVCGAFPSGQPVTLRFDGQVLDEDINVAGCDGAVDHLSFTWRLTGLPSGSHAALTPLSGGTCRPPGAGDGQVLVTSDAAAQVCLWPDAVTLGSAADYVTRLAISDGIDSVSTGSFHVNTDADVLPCVTGSDPPMGSYVIDREQPASFAITSAIDDRDHFGDTMTFAWSLWRGGDPVWRPIPDYASQSAYLLDASHFAVGEMVRVRVELFDRTGVAGGCPLDSDVCLVSSCLVTPPPSCRKWITWDLELR